MPIKEIHDESAFLSMLEQEPIDFEPLRRWLEHEFRAGRRETADSSAELMQVTLADQGLTDQALLILRMRAAHHPAPEAFRKVCEEEALAAVGPAPDDRALVYSAGFDEEIPLAECFRRLELLRALKPGTLCYDATWGAGTVRGTDGFYKKVTIDFEKRRGHELSYAYAGETLKLLDEDHLLARKMRDPQALEALIASDPAEIVRITLRSFGDMPVAMLQEVLIPRLMPESGWKAFWEAARRVLKKDPLFEIPAKRTDPLRILHKEKGFDGDWFSALAGERDMGALLERMDDYIAAGADAPSPEQLEALGERLAFVVKGAGLRHLDWRARAAMAADDLKVPASVVNAPELYETFFDAAHLHQALRGLSARDMKALLQHMLAFDAERMRDLLLSVLSQLEMPALNEAMELLLANGAEEQCRAIFRELTVESQVADVEVLYWLLRHPEYMAKWELGTPGDHARWVVRALETQHSGEKLKTQNQLRKTFSKDAWLGPVLETMSPSERRELFLRIKESPGWEMLDRRALLGLIIKRYPELEEEMRTSSESTSSDGAERGPLTSRRSYEARQRQFQKLVMEEIPAAAKDIATAREYGDLRENFEYKAAKDRQALLLQRKADLEAMLNKVRPTTFDQVPTDRAGRGCMVTLRYADGREETFTILGAWDRDESLNIISSDSRMAVALRGHRKGSRAVVPSEAGEVPCTVAEIAPLSDAVREWVNGAE
ncbi:MAG TPA: GreA/GreB family elongation factor [Kiritimatiellia bacterium]|nr:GreA/GreB family elongation factor [Kiritimatiellia bacterium]